PRLLQRGTRVDESWSLRDHLERVADRFDLFGTRIENGEEDVILRRPLRWHDDQALALEVVCDAARIAHIPAIAGHDGPHVGGGTVLVVRQTFDQKRYSLRAV